MKTQINEIKRMQQLAGIINESQLNEVDTSLLGGIAKNLYLYLSKLKPNNPVDINGTPLKNIKGDPITHDKKVKMSYQNAQLAKQGKAKELGKIVQGGVVTSRPEVSVNYYGNSNIFVGGFVKKEEAEAALKYILDKYPNQLTGLRGEPTVVPHKMDYEWAKNYAPDYGFDIKLKDDKALAKAQSTKPAAVPVAESFDQLDEIVDKVLAKLRSINEENNENMGFNPSETADALDQAGIKYKVIDYSFVITRPDGETAEIGDGGYGGYAIYSSDDKIYQERSDQTIEDVMDALIPWFKS
jgi:hypothetical protein